MNLIIKKSLHTLFGLLLTASLGLPVQAEEVMYYHLDALGSAVAATDATGAVLWTESYEPYGERRERNDGGTNSQWFTGKAQDDAVGLNYFGARWYNSRVGRFTAMDPVGFGEENPQSFNRYAYANNNPYRFVDPDGETAVQALRNSFLVGTRIGNVINTGIEAILGVSLGSALFDLVHNENGDEGGSDSSGGDTKKNDRPSNVENPEEALESIEKAKNKLNKTRPSIADPDGDWEGAKKRPKQSTINSTEKSKQRGANDRNRRGREGRKERKSR